MSKHNKVTGTGDRRPEISLPAKGTEQQHHTNHNIK